MIIIYIIPTVVVLLCVFIVIEKRKVESQPQALSVDEIESIVNDWYPRVKGILSYLSSLSGAIAILSWLSPSLVSEITGQLDIIIPAILAIVGAIGKLVSKAKPGDAIIIDLNRRRIKEAA